MGTDPFRLPKDVECKLAEIFTDRGMDAVRAACRRYLYETGEKKPSIVDDGSTLMKISEKAGELRQLLKRSESALERVYLHVSEKYGKHDTLSWIDDLKERLRILDNMCFVNPARERAENSGRGKPKGTKNFAARALAFALWDCYKQIHGRPARRIVDKEKNETGPLPTAARLLGPLLDLPTGGLTGYFREIGETYGQKIKSTKRE